MSSDASTKELRRTFRRLSRNYEMVNAMQGSGGGEATVTKRVLLVAQSQFLSHYWSDPPSWRMTLRALSPAERAHPDFAVAGAIKGGTSDLAMRLMLHPAVMTPLAKEIWMPNAKYWPLFFPTARQKERHRRRVGAAVNGLFTPCLSQVPYADALASLNPKARIVVPLRNPTKRAYSHWKWELFKGGNWLKGQWPDLASFDRYVDLTLELYPEVEEYAVSTRPMLKEGIYHRSLEYWMERFGRGNVLVFDVDEYFRDRAGVLAGLHEFLGLEPRPGDGDAALEIVNENPISAPPPSEEARRKLDAFYAPFNERLFTLIGRRFDW